MSILRNKKKGTTVLKEDTAALQRRAKQPCLCDKCARYIPYHETFGYSHRCVGRIEEIRRGQTKLVESANSAYTREARDFLLGQALDMELKNVYYDPSKSV